MHVHARWVIVAAVIAVAAAGARADFVELGPSDNLTLDQPRVAVELLADAEGLVSLGPGSHNTFVLDTGASSIIAAGSAQTELKAHGYVTEGTHLEQGVAGFTLMDVSAPYRFDFAGTDGARQSLPDVRILSSATLDLDSFDGVVGMPAMIGRVTSLDMTVWSGGIDFFDPFIHVAFSEGLPGEAGHRYSIPVRPVSFDPTGEQPLPTAAPLPSITARPAHRGTAVPADFVVDTGAQISMISTQLAMDLGLDANGNGDLSDEALGTVPVGGIGGQAEALVMEVDEIRLPTEQGVDLVWTDLQWLVTDIDPRIEGVFGADLMTSGWLAAALAGGPDGYIDKVRFDFRDIQDGTGAMYLDLNADVDRVRLTGDIDESGAVDQGDLNRLLGVFGAEIDSRWRGGDLDGNRRVDDADLNLLLAGFGKTATPEIAALSIPEPSGMVLAVLGAIGLIGLIAASGPAEHSSRAQHRKEETGRKRPR